MVLTWLASKLKDELGAQSALLKGDTQTHGKFNTINIVYTWCNENILVGYTAFAYTVVYMV